MKNIFFFWWNHVLQNWCVQSMNAQIEHLMKNWWSFIHQACVILMVGLIDPIANRLWKGIWEFIPISKELWFDEVHHRKKLFEIVLHGRSSHQYATFGLDFVQRFTKFRIQGLLMWPSSQNMESGPGFNREMWFSSAIFLKVSYEIIMTPPTWCQFSIIVFLAPSFCLWKIDLINIIDT